MEVGQDQISWAGDLVSFDVIVQVEFTSAGSRVMMQSGNTVNGSLTMEFFRMLQETTGYLIQSNEYLIYDCLPVSAQNAFAEFDFESLFDGGEAEENEIETEEDEDSSDYIKWVRSLSL